MSADPTSLEHARVLVLDVSYRPSAVISWQRAMTLLVKESARPVAYYPDLSIRSASETWLCPAVISNRGKLRAAKSGARFNRRGVYKRDGYICQFCGIGYSPNDLTLDHVLPKSRGGKLTWENAVTACLPCNQRKRDRTPKEAGMSVLNTPCAPGYMSFADMHDITTLPDAWTPYLESR